jgi:hypothetical protein
MTTTTTPVEYGIGDTVTYITSMGTARSVKVTERKLAEGWFAGRCVTTLMTVWGHDDQIVEIDELEHHLQSDDGSECDRARGVLGEDVECATPWEHFRDGQVDVMLGYGTAAYVCAPVAEAVRCSGIEQ